MCWAFGVDEGDLPRIYWSLSFREIRQRIQLKFGELAAGHLCTYNSLASNISAALGGSSDDTADEPVRGASLEAQVANINNLLRF